MGIRDNFTNPFRYSKRLTWLQANLLMALNGGNLDLCITPIQKLPKNLTVRGNLDLRITPIQSLPDNLIVHGSLDLSDVPIQSLPDNLTVDGDLKLCNTKIKSLPNNLMVGGDLCLKLGLIESLPDDLTVGGSLDLNFSSIQSLPDNLTVRGNLDLGATLIQSLPDNLTVHGSLNLSSTPIQRLPDSLTVNGDLDLNNSDIQCLPDNLTVNGNLDLYNTSIRCLPENLKVSGKICPESLRRAPSHQSLENLAIPGQAKELYESVTHRLDPDGFVLFHSAEDILGKFDYSHFAYEDNIGTFEEADGYDLLKYLLVDHCDQLGETNRSCVRWEIVEGTCYEKCTNLMIDETTPEYQQFEETLYQNVCRKLGIVSEPKLSVDSREAEQAVTGSERGTGKGQTLDSLVAKAQGKPSIAKQSPVPAKIPTLER